MDEKAVLAAAYAFRKALENLDQPEKSSLQRVPQVAALPWRQQDQVVLDLVAVTTMGVALERVLALG